MKQIKYKTKAMILLAIELRYIRRKAPKIL